MVEGWWRGGGGAGTGSWCCTRRAHTSDSMQTHRRLRPPPLHIPSLVDVRQTKHNKLTQRDHRLLVVVPSGDTREPLGGPVASSCLDSTDVATLLVRPSASAVTGGASITHQNLVHRAAREGYSQGGLERGVLGSGVAFLGPATRKRQAGSPPPPPPPPPPPVPTGVNNRPYQQASSTGLLMSTRKPTLERRWYG